MIHNLISYKFITIWYLNIIITALIPENCWPIIIMQVINKDLRLAGSCITRLNVHLSEKTSKFSNSQLISDTGIPLKWLNSKKKKKERKEKNTYCIKYSYTNNIWSRFKKYMFYVTIFSSLSIYDNYIYILLHKYTCLNYYKLILYNN